MQKIKVLETSGASIEGILNIIPEATVSKDKGHFLVIIPVEMDIICVMNNLRKEFKQKNVWQ